MIDLKIAISNAKDFVKNEIHDRPVKNLLVEEVELSENEKYWLITLGWDDRIVPRSPLESAMGLSNVPDRDYRVFFVDVDSGNVVKMKFRE